MSTGLRDEALRLQQEAFFTLGHPDPYPVFRRLREIAPVHRNPLGVVVLSRRLCESLLRDRRLGRGDWLLRSPDYGRSPFRQSWARMLVSLDPPQHTRIRALVTKAFSPSVVEGLRPYVGAFVDARLAEGVRRPEFDVVGELAFVLPVTVIGELIGIPEADRPQFRDWSRTIMRAMGSPVPPDEHVQAADVATEASEAYLRALVRDRAKQPRDDLASRLVLAEEAGDQLHEDEVVSNLSFLTMAGFETTMYSIGTSVLTLLRHPDQLALLREGSVTAAQATEELLRFEPPLIWASRVALEDMDIGDVTVAAGTPVACVMAAANRDPEAVADPDQLDLRRPQPRPLSFGGGAHYCLGAALARLEIEEALTRLFALPEVELLDEHVEWAPMPGIFRGPARLRLRLAC